MLHDATVTGLYAARAWEALGADLHIVKLRAPLTKWVAVAACVGCGLDVFGYSPTCIGNVQGLTPWQF